MVQLPDDRSFRTTGEENGQFPNVVSDDDGEDEEEQEEEEEETEFIDEQKGGNPLYHFACRAIVVVQVLWLGFTTVVDFFLKLLLKTVFVVTGCVALTLIIRSITASTTDGEARPTPTQDLQTFVISKKADMPNKISSIEDIKTSTFQSYAAAYCVEGATLEKTRRAVKTGLMDVPEVVRDKIVERALLDGVSSRSQWMDTNADLDNHAKAHSYMGFYSTTVKNSNGHIRGEEEDVYETCVSVSGISFTMAQIVVGYDEREEQKQVGTKLECRGYFFPECDRIPSYTTVKTRSPIFNKSKLSLKEQKQLNQWMVSEAIASAEALVGHSALPSVDSNGQLPGSSASDDGGDHDDDAWKWNPPKEEL